MKKLELLKDHIRGNTPLLILAVLEGQELHGYAIGREITTRSKNRIKLSEAIIYPTLHALERDGLVVGEWITPATSNVPRKVYRLTDKGRTELAERRRDWRTFVDATDTFLGDTA